MYIVIPCYNEPDLISTLQSLKHCELPNEPVKVLVIINQSEQEREEAILQNQKTFLEATHWAKENSNSQLSFKIQHHILPKKHAGVGLARRIGMDKAADYFFENNNPNGVIVCFDADSTVAKDYLVEIENHFNKYPKTPAASIYYEHDLEKCESEANQEAILNYELFLRYYIEGLKFANYPYAFHTIGSSMAVRANIYKKQGGMNKRKAGEDFYFLHKIMPLGGFTEVITTTVYPSSRSSNRVPFGTGKAVNDWYKREEKILYTYNPIIFDELKVLVSLAGNTNKSEKYEDLVKELPKGIQNFLQQHKGNEGWENAYKNSADDNSFKKRYMLWWDGFRILKLVHFLRDEYYPNTPIQQAAIELLAKNKKVVNDDLSLYDLLMLYRDIQRN